MKVIDVGPVMRHHVRRSGGNLDQGRKGLGNIPIRARKCTAIIVSCLVAWLPSMAVLARSEATPGDGLPAGIVILLIVIVLALGILIQSANQRFR